jgi:hypothetical protein
MEDVTVTVEVPEPLAGRLAAEAERRGLTVEELALEAIEGQYGPHRVPQVTGERDAVAAFIGCVDSGDPTWASRDIHELRAEAAERKLVEGA